MRTGTRYCGALMFFERDQRDEDGFAQRARAAGISSHDLQRFAEDAYPELDPAAALRAYRRDVREAQQHPNDCLADYTPFKRSR